MREKEIIISLEGHLSVAMWLEPGLLKSPFRKGRGGKSKIGNLTRYDNPEGYMTRGVRLRDPICDLTREVNWPRWTGPRQSKWVGELSTHGHVMEDRTNPTFGPNLQQFEIFPTALSFSLGLSPLEARIEVPNTTAHGLDAVNLQSQLRRTTCQEITKQWWENKEAMIREN